MYYMIGAGVVALLVIWFINWIISLRRVVPTNQVHIVQSAKNTVS